MVKLVEIEDNEGYDSDSQYTTDSEDARSVSAASERSGLDEEEDEDSDDYETDSDYDDYLDESLLERLSALKDIVPVEHRTRVSSAVSAVARWSGLGAGLVGKLAWVFTTSALLVVFPLAIESDREKMMQQWEAEQGGAGGAAAAGQMPQGHQQPYGGMMPGAPAGGAPGLAPGVVA
ncbi:mitochondrial import receptor subunit Tom22 [Coemansia erecta]|uniref:Mitochondrial import receptor subunit Tom22 n=1 Tax=Coemansia erecta TaxID=147472 RepID=A0A9W8CPY2_9FUNG|nr:mitochondrial import receptor subunit Tom22 [Coemansia erecta]